MRRIGLAGMIGAMLLLGACGGASDEPATPEESAAATAAPAEATETPAAGETPAAEATPTPTASATTAAPAVAVTAPASFTQCKVCHSVERGKHGVVGPSLAGIFGTTAGDVAGFEFSSAMKESGLVWNEANLDRYLADPRAVVPGTKMAYVGLKDAAKRKEVIDYLKSL